MFSHTEYSLGSLKLGHLPRVAGVITSAQMLYEFCDYPRINCDAVEVRPDLMNLAPSSPEIINRCENIEADGFPVIYTPRLAAEGGQWQDEDEDRRPLFMSAIANLSAVDVELRSPLAKEVVNEAAMMGKTAIVSFHDFDQTPSLEELKDIIARIHDLGRAVIKIATMINAPEDIERLALLLQENSTSPMCVLGMGPEGRRTRIDFPKLGSCLTYGYIDNPSAPGQHSCRDLVSELRHAVPEYDAELVSKGR